MGKYLAESFKWISKVPAKSEENGVSEKEIKIELKQLGVPDDGEFGSNGILSS